MLLEQAQALIAQRQYDAAYQLLAEHRDDPSLAIVRGQAATSSGRYAEALRSFAFANSAMPDVEDAAVRYGQELIVQGKRDEALRHLTDAVARFSDSPILHYLKTRLNIDERGVVACGEEIRWLYSLLPNAAELRMLLEALEAIEKGFAPLMDFGSPQRNAIWQDFRFELQHKSARFFGTSVGLLRFALQNAPGDGLTLEFGVFHGLSTSVLAAHTRGIVDGFDSFQGLPEAWHPGEGAGTYSTSGRQPKVGENVRFHVGWFADTVPPFMAATSTPVRFAHIDCDLYSSTMTALNAIKKNLTRGSVLVFDDFVGFASAREHEFRAWNDFVAANAIDYEYIGFVILDRAAAVMIR